MPWPLAIAFSQAHVRMARRELPGRGYLQTRFFGRSQLMRSLSLTRPIFEQNFWEYIYEILFSELEIAGIPLTNPEFGDNDREFASEGQERYR